MNQSKEKRREYVLQLSSFVKELRTEVHMSQKEFAEDILGISDRQLLRIESGTSTLQITELMTIMNYFDLSAEEIFSRISFEESYYKKQRKYNNLLREVPLDVVAVEEVLDSITEEEYQILPEIEKNTLDVIAAFCIAYRTNDTKPLEKVLKSFSILNKRKLKYSNFELIILSVTLTVLRNKKSIWEIIDILERELNQAHSKEKKEIIISGIQNGFVTLIDLKVPIDVTYFERLEAYVLEHKMYTLMVSFYRHYAYNNRFIGRPYEAEFQKAIQLSEIYQFYGIIPYLYDEFPEMKK